VSLLFAYRSLHRKYKEASEMKAAQTANQSALGNRKLPLKNDRDLMTQAKRIGTKVVAG